MENTLSVIPLGGVEEIGLNMTIFEYNEDILVVDAGLMFPEEDTLGVDFIIPDYSYLINNKEKVVLIDVRTPQEHNEAHIPGSILMPLDTLESVTALPEGDRHIIYCRSGKRSLKAI